MKILDATVLSIPKRQPHRLRAVLWISFSCSCCCWGGWADLPTILSPVAGLKGAREPTTSGPPSKGPEKGYQTQRLTEPSHQPSVEGETTEG